MADFGCDDHATAHAPKMHPEHMSKGDKHLGEHERAVPPPAHHTKGKLPSHLQPDHGPHK